MKHLVQAARILVTLALMGCAAVLVVLLWNIYMRTPWTRDGRVFVQTVVVAPEVSGTVLAVPLRDNMPVRKGQLLFQIDQARFALAVDQAAAQLRVAELQVVKARDDAARRRGLDGLVSKEDIANMDIASGVADANLRDARASLALAKLNLARTTLRAPVDGVVSHLRLQAGDYANAGTAAISLIDARSFRVIGYFEETKLDKIRVGDPVSIKLMGYPQRLPGHVGSIGRGISDQNDVANTRGLPEVNPVFDWVRLAQRIPVDVVIDRVPANVSLSAGMTASLNVGRELPPRSGAAGRIQQWLEDRL